MDKALIDVIEAKKKEGMPAVVIRFNLHMMNKWTDEVIDEGIRKVFTPQSQSQPTNQIQGEPTPQPVVPPVVIKEKTDRKSFSLRKSLLTLVVLLVVGLGYLVYSRISVLGSVEYKESNFLTGILMKWSDIKTSTYKSTFSLNVGPRDGDAVPYPVQVDPQTEYPSYSFSDAIAFLPPDMSAEVSLTASADWEEEESKEWKFNIDANGDFGDLTYKINVDSLKKDGVVYYRINNFPSIFFFSELAAYKGQWIKSDPNNPGTNMFSAFSDPYFGNDMKEQRKEFENFVSKLAQVADKNKLFNFKSSLKKEKIDGVTLIRYDLEIRQEAIRPFYNEFKTEYAKLFPEVDGRSLFEEMDKLINGKDFERKFEIYNQNTGLTLWTDTEGFPAKIAYKIRVVPPDTATQFAEKQANLTFQLDVIKINEPVEIDIPTDAKTLDEIAKDEPKSPLGSAISQGNDAKVKANLSSLRAYAEVYYDNQAPQSYGPVTNSCASGMFVDSYSGLKAYTTKSNYPSGTILICRSNGATYTVAASLANGQYWCVDNRGTSQKQSAAPKAGIYSCK